MKRFVYSPDIEAYVQTKNGILDLSDDIINGSITLRLNAVSNFSLTLQNPARKYLDQSMTPMDPIVIYLTRIKRMLAFSGYLDSTPIDQLYPEPVTITGSCTLKRLLYTYWNPQLPYVEQFLSSMGWTLDPLTGNILDNTGKSAWNLDAQGSLGNMMQQILHKIGGWDLGVNDKGKRVNTSKNSVQILALPKQFISVTKDILTAQKAGQVMYESTVTNFLNQLLTVNGITTDPFGTGSASQSATDSVTDHNPLPLKFKGKYKAFTYGPNTNLSGFAAVLKKEAAKNGHDLNASQCQSASTIVKAAIDNGFTAKAGAAFVASAWAESNLIADAVEHGKTKGVRLNVGYGLFQLTETTSTDEWIGLPSGTYSYVAKAVKQITDKTVNVTPGDQYELSALYNSTARAISISDTDKEYINNSSDPLALISRIQYHGSVQALDASAPNSPNGYDYVTGKPFYTIVWSALQKNQNTSTGEDTKTSGVIGDVRVGDPAMVGTYDRHHDENISYSYRIKPNPFNNPTFIFNSVKYDSSLKKDEISIWCPQDSNIAEAWNNGKEVSIETSLPGKPFPPSTGSSDYKDAGIAQKALAVAIKQLGKPYHWGDENPKTGFDCSGLTAYAYSKVGISLPHNAQAQFDQGPDVPNGDPLQPGDLIFFGSSKKGINHVGMVVDPTSHKMIVAPSTGQNVQYQTYPAEVGDVWASGDVKYFVGASRPAATSDIVKITSPQADGTGLSFTSQTFSQAVAAYGMGLPLVFPMALSAEEAQLFEGQRAYQDAQPLMNLVEFICKASGRNFKSSPRGDFFAFYPDYFNWTKTAPYFVITDIETQDLTINFTDQPLATHVYTTADTFAAGSINISEQLFSTVASIEDLGSFPDLVDTGKHFNFTSFLERYGARPLNEEVPEIKNSFMQFMFGWMTFLEQWAKLFEANPTFTFMPELIPGGLVNFASRDLTMFVNEVTHNIDRRSGFTTTANLISPSTSKGHYALSVITGGIQP